MAGMNKTMNEYAVELAADYGRTPKAVLAAIAVSALTCGGDYLETAQRRVRKEWWALYHTGIVPQRPPFPEPDEE